MQKHRGLLMSLALSAFLGLMGNQAQAGFITVTVTLSGTVIETVTSTSTTTFSVNTAVLDAHLAAAGSVYSFSGLQVNSSNPGGLPAFLQTNAQVTEVAGTNTEEVVITTTQGGFLAPTGPGGVLASSAVANVSPSTGGSTTYSSDYTDTATPPVTTNAPDITLAGTVSSGTSSAIVGNVLVTGYSLSNTLTISYTGTGNSQGITGTASITAIPEPSSVVMLLTGMPLPLAIAFRLIRRRRAGA